MADIGNLLNPQPIDKGGGRYLILLYSEWLWWHNPFQCSSNSSAGHSPGAQQAHAIAFMNAPPVPVRFYAQYLSHRNVHEQHTGCPNSLSCLADTDLHPDASYETLVRCAILGSSEANQQLPVHEILAALKGKYPYFRSEEAGRALEVSVPASTKDLPKSHQRRRT